MASTAEVMAQVPELGAQELLAIYYQMLLTRATEERVWALNRQGKVPIVSSSQGHEAAQMGAVWALDRVQDLFFLYYRDVAAAIALGVTPRELLLGYMAREGEPFSGARQFPLHGAYPRLHIINLSNVVGANIPHAVGAALAAKIRRETTVVLASFGDGATSEGEWHEALNFAGVHQLPVLFLCQNNRYAISVPLRKQMRVKSVADRAAAYGFPGVSIDGCDVTAVYQATREAAQRAREGHGPTLIEARVERLLPHTTDDDDRRYRSAEEIQEARRRDPIKLLSQRLKSEGLLDSQSDDEYQKRAKAEVDAATEQAEAAAYPPSSTFGEHVYSSTQGVPAWQ